MYLRKYYLLSALLIIFGWGCQKDGEPTPEDPNDKDTTITKDDEDTLKNSSVPPFAVFEYQVDPKTTDAQIDKGLSTQYAYIPKNASERKTRLFIFLPGTFAKPQTYLKITKAAAENGYCSFGIAYDDNKDVGSYCGSTNDDQCDAKVLKEFFEGTDSSPNVIVGEANGFKNRIIKMIKYLDAAQPTQNWKQFLNEAGQIRWDLISLAGHSQGSGHTTYISKQVALFRATLLSGPNGFALSNGNYPSWINTQGATPIERIFGFTNKNDNLAQWQFVSAVWQELKLPGQATRVDNNNAFNNSHQLFTEIIPPNTPGSASPTHGSTSVDIVTPIATNGRPAFEAIWKYMCFPE